ncbi:tetratricopeptide repeat protein [Melioribacter sp. Ez-97]|uniref:tetratricopeptide repeat protein n=1 Tax=Melioribacter sp. Ez-97 TaxID=3423434 RepID=UPI003ED9765C
MKACLNIAFIFALLAHPVFTYAQIRPDSANSSTSVNDSLLFNTNNSAARPKENDSIYVQSGNFFFEKNMYREAAEQYYAAYRLNPENKPLKFRLAETYYLLNDFKEAKELFEELQYETEDNAIIPEYLGQIAIAERDYPSIKKYFNRILEIDSTNMDALNTLGTLAMFNDDNYTAEVLLRKSVEFHPRNINGLYNLGTLYLLNNRFNQAEEYLLKAYFIDSLDSKITYTLGLLYIGLERYIKAERFLNISLSLLQNNPDAWIALYITQKKLNKLKDARNAIEKIEELFPDNAHINLLKADYYYSTNDLNEAIYYAEKEIKNNPEQIIGYQILSTLYRLAGKPEKAGYYKNIINNKPRLLDSIAVPIINYLDIALIITN